MGRRPLISENGASTMGASANPMQKIVMPRLYTTALMSHSCVKGPEAGVISPAEYPASAVTAHEIQVIIDLRHFGHRKGEVYLARLGGSGGADWPGPGGAVMHGVGRAVSRSR